MATDTWPGTLPDPLMRGFSQRRQSNVLRSQMGYGPAKVRRRSSAAISPVTNTIVLTGALVTTLETFHNTTLKDGTIRFNWTNQLTDATVEFRFTSPPQYAPAGPDLWNVALNLEILP